MTKSTQEYTIKKSLSQIIIISLLCLIIGHLLNPNNLLLSAFGFAIISYIIYNATLKHGDFFSFIIVIYFCSLFQYWTGHGGAFNYVSLFSITAYWIKFRRLPNEFRNKDRYLNFLILLFFFSSVLGWVFNYIGASGHILLSILSFTGLMLLFIVSTRLMLTVERIKVFYQINLFLAVYSLIASLNKFIGVITFKTPMMPIYGEIESNYYESGGIIGSSPLNGEFSMMIFVFFVILGIFGNEYILKKKWVYLGAFVSILNVFLSISRSAFISSLFGVIISLMAQPILTFVNVSRGFKNFFMILFFSIITLFVVYNSGFNYVFKRLESTEGYKIVNNATLVDRIMDGTAFERKETFDISYEKYYSKSNWILGYGWGLGDDNRNAFYKDVNENITSVHSQFWAILFLFGWFGLIIYYLLYFIAIRKSWKVMKLSNNMFVNNKILAFYFVVSHILFLLNEIKVDCIYLPGYFAVTMILLGLTYSNLNTIKQKLNITI
jgi:hypothetical protein